MAAKRQVSYNFPAFTFCSIYLLHKDESILWIRKTEKERVMEPTEGNSDIAEKLSSKNSSTELLSHLGEL